MARDAGLQPERTRLAWRRTALAVTVVALLAIRLAVTRVGGPTGWAVAAAAMLGWIGALWVTQRRVAAMSALRPIAIGRALPLTALTIIGYAAVGAFLVLTGRG
ncbi:MAG TPA: DUF202 domain-containing protein [Micromonosporaceae bacterium]|jgi:uncharacterized membrane protein YidH (DUF202 family)